MRRLCSGKTLAFQAKDAGSIPARRSNFQDYGSTIMVLLATLHKPILGNVRKTIRVNI